MNRLHETPRLGLIVTALVAFAVYARTLGFDLVWDDLGLLTYMDQVRSEGGWPALLTAEFRLDAPYGYYRPLVLLGLGFDQAFAGGASWPFHLQNILFHAFNSVLVMLIARRWLGGGIGPSVAGLIFAVHPAHVESVAFVSGRTDVLATTFALLAVILWSRERPGDGLRRTVLFGLCVLASLLSKEVALALPAALLVLSLLGLRDDGGEGSWFARNVRWLAAVVGALAVFVLLRVVVADVGFGMLGTGATVNQVAPVRDDPGLFLRLWLNYGRLLVWPWPLNAFYTPGGLDLMWPAVTSGAIVVLGVLWAPARHHRLGLAMAAWIIIFLLPVSGLVPLRGAVMAERFLYLPSVGWCVLLGYGISRLLPWLGERLGPDAAMVTTFIVIGVIGLGAATVYRTDVWRNEVNLFESIVGASPDAVLAHNNLATAYGKLGRQDEALHALADAVRLKPDYVEAWTNIGFIHLQAGRHREAVTAYRTALKYDSGYAHARHDLVVTLMEAGDTETALAEYAELQRTAPTWAKGLVGLMQGVTAP